MTPRPLSRTAACGKMRPHHYLIIGAAAIALSFGAGWWLRPCRTPAPVYTDTADSLRIIAAQAQALTAEAIARADSIEARLEALRDEPIPSQDDTYRAVHSSGLDSIRMTLMRKL